MLPKKNQWVLEVVFMGHVLGWVLAAILIAADAYNRVPLTADQIFHQIGKCLAVAGGGSMAIAAFLYWIMTAIFTEEPERIVPREEKKTFPKIACAMPFDENLDEPRNRTRPYLM